MWFCCLRVAADEKLHPPTIKVIITFRKVLLNTDCPLSVKQGKNSLYKQKKTMPGGRRVQCRSAKLANLGNRRGWLVSLPGRFTRPERASNTHWIGGWVCRRAVFDTVLMIKLSATTGNRTLILWSFSPQTDDTDWTIAAPYTMQNTKMMLQSTVRLLMASKTLISGRNCACIFAEWRDMQYSVSNTSYLAILVQRLGSPCSFADK
jgi:hypothetical protein